MKKMARSLSLILVVFSLFSSVIGCGSEKETQDSISGSSSSQATNVDVKEEPLKVNYLSLTGWASDPQANNFMQKWLLENKNIDMQFSFVGDKQEDRMNMMLASGEMPDVVQILTGENHINILNRWADAGLVVPVDEWLAKYPNILKFCDEKYNKYVYSNKKDGKMYMVPGNPAANEATIEMNIGPIIREDWLKKVGKEAPKTVDELYDVLKAFKEQIPAVGGKEIIPATFNAWRQLFGYTWTKSWYTLPEDMSKLDWYFTNPDLEGYLVYMNKLYRDGLLDKETIIQKDDQCQSKLNSGRVGFTIAVLPWMDNANKALKEIDPNARFIPCPLIRVPGKPLPMLQSTKPGMAIGIAVSKKFAENPRNVERFMEFLNWNASNEGSFILNNGPEGEFTVKNSEGLYVNKPEIKAETAKANNVFQQRTGLTYYNLLTYPIVPAMADKGYTEEVKLAQSVWKEGLVPENPYFDMAGTGPLWNEKWGSFWGELPKWEAKAILTAKSEEECKKIATEMFATFEKNGGRDVANEKLKLYKDLAEKLK